MQSSICQNQCPRLYIRTLRDFSPPSLPLFGAAQRPHLHSPPAPDGHEQLSLALDQTTLGLSLLLLPEEFFFICYHLCFPWVASLTDSHQDCFSSQVLPNSFQGFPSIQVSPKYLPDMHLTSLAPLLLIVHEQVCEHST